MNNKEVVKTLFEKVLNGRDMEVLDLIIADEYVDRSPVPGLPEGLEGIKVKLESLYSAFPDIEFKLGDLVAEGDLVAARYHWTATHEGEFMGVPATGKAVDVKGMDFYRISEGRIVEHWDCIEIHSLMQQLGTL